MPERAVSREAREFLQAIYRLSEDLDALAETVGKLNSFEHGLAEQVFEIDSLNEMGKRAYKAYQQLSTELASEESRV